MTFPHQNLENSERQENYFTSLFLDKKQNKEKFFIDSPAPSSYEDISDEVLFFEDQCDPSIHHVPPFNVEKISKHFYRLTVLMPGVSMDNIQIEQKKNKVMISIKPPLNLVLLNEAYKSIHFGIFDILKPNRPFEFQVNLPKGVEITKTVLEEGLLKIDLQKRA